MWHSIVKRARNVWCPVAVTGSTKHTRSYSTDSDTREYTGRRSTDRTQRLPRALHGRLQGEPAALVRVLVPLNDAQARFQILCVSATSRLSIFIRTLTPKATSQAAEDYDKLIERGLASIFAGEEVKEVDLSSLDETCDYTQTARDQSLLGQGAMREARLSLHEREYELASAVDTGSADNFDGSPSCEQERSLRRPELAPAHTSTSSTTFPWPRLSYKCYDESPAIPRGH